MNKLRFILFSLDEHPFKALLPPCIKAAKIFAAYYANIFAVLNSNEGYRNYEPNFRSISF